MTPDDSNSRTFRFPSGRDLCGTGRGVLREHLALEVLAAALLQLHEFHIDVLDIREARTTPTERARLYVSGKPRLVVAELLKRAAATMEMPNLTTLAGARCYWVEDTSGRWVVPTEHGDVEFSEDGEGEALELAHEHGEPATYRAGTEGRSRRYTLGASFMTPLQIGGHVVTARRAGRCLGWIDGPVEGDRPCRSYAVTGYRPYCSLHGGWSFRHRRGAWEADRDNGVRLLFGLAQPLSGELDAA